MDPVYDVISTFSSYFVNFGGLPQRFKGDFVEWLFVDYLDVLVYFEVLYVLLIYYGPKWMKDRPALELRAVNTIWNLFLTLFSFSGAMGTIVLLFYSIEHYGWYITSCHYQKHILYDGEYAFWIYAFLLSKFPEMIDTVLLVLQKKPLIFLHWYHHLTVAIFCWYAARSLIASGVYFATMNYCVHSIMYFYYFMCSLKLRKLVRPFAPLITGLQLLQMVVGCIIIGYTFYMSYFSERGCGVDRRTIRFGIGMYGSYLVLFALLFVRLYLKKGKKGKGEGEGREKREKKDE